MTVSPAEQIEPGPTGSDQGASAGTPPAVEAELDTAAAIQQLLENGGASPAPDATAKPDEGEATGSDGEPDPKASETPPDGKASEDPGSEIDRDPNLPVKTKGRIDYLLGERKQLREENVTLKARADAAERIYSFTERAGLTADDVNSGFQIMAALKRNPAKAVEMLKPILERAELAAGIRLPADIEQQHEDGALSEAAAKELAALRLEVAQLRTGQTKATEAAARQTAQAVGLALDEFEEGWKKVDPAFDKKIDLVIPMVTAEFDRRKAAGEVITPALAKKIASDARKKVEGTLGALLPPKTSTTKEPGVRRTAAVQRGGEEVSTAEGIRAILEGRDT